MKCLFSLSPIRLLLCITACLLATVHPGISHAQEAGAIITVAGGSLGDGLPATKASLIFPMNMALDNEGNLLIVDTGLLRKLNFGDGTLTTLAGQLIRYREDDVVTRPPTGPLLARDIAVDAQNNRYVADYYNNCVHQITPDGAITRFAGTGEFGSSGDEGPAAQATLKSPTGVAVDSKGRVYILEGTDGRIRVVDDEKKIHTYAVTLGRPVGLAIDGEDNLYYILGSRVYRLAPNGSPVVVAGSGTTGYSGDGGLATRARLNRPSDVAVDGEGSLYIADQENFVVRKVDPNRIITTFAGIGPGNMSLDANGQPYPEDRFAGDGGPAEAARLNRPAGVMVDREGRLLIADSGNRRVRRVDPQGVITTLAGGHGDGNLATQTHLHLPLGMAVDLSGNLYIADGEAYRIRKVSPEGVLTTAAGNGTVVFPRHDLSATQTALQYPNSVVTDRSGNFYLSYPSVVLKVDSQGNVTVIAGGGDLDEDHVPATSVKLRDPRGLALDRAGNLYISEYWAHRVRKVDPNGIITTYAGQAPPLPEGSNSYQGGFSGDGGPATEAQLYSPSGLATDRHGNLFIADTRNGRIRRVTADRIIDTVSGWGKPDSEPLNLGYFNSIALDAEGHLYVAESHLHPPANLRGRALKFAPDLKTYSIIAGGGETYEEGEPATEALLQDTRDAVIDAEGNLYLSDRDHQRVFKVIGVAAPGLVAGDPMRLTLEPSTAALQSGQSQRFTVRGEYPVTWSILEGEGTLDPDGTYRAPDEIREEGTVTITAAATEVPGLTATATIRLLPPLWIEPETVTLQAGETQLFRVSPEGFVSWSLVSETGETTIEADGAINADGSYTAPPEVAESREVIVRAEDEAGRVATARVHLEVKPFAPGDVNRDGSVDVSDAILVLRYLVDLAALDAEQLQIGDLTGEGEVSVADAVAILRRAVGL